MVLPRVLYVRVVETREIQLLSESARNWICKIRLQSVKLCEHGICGTTYVRYYIQRKCTADMTSVGLAQARPNYYTNVLLHELKYNILHLYQRVQLDSMNLLHTFVCLLPDDCTICAVCM